MNKSQNQCIPVNVLNQIDKKTKFVLILIKSVC